MRDITEGREYSSSETAVALGVDDSTVRRLCEAGHLPGAFKKTTIGHSRWVIPGSAIIHILKERQNTKE